MVTGSHNPKDYNGFKMVLAGRAIYGEEIQALRAMMETDRRRAKQEAYNLEHGITPATVKKNVEDVLAGLYKGDTDMARVTAKIDPTLQGGNIQTVLEGLRLDMRKAAENLEFMEAAQYRDEMKALEERLTELNSNPL